MVPLTPRSIEFDLPLGQSLCLVFDSETEQQEVVYGFLCKEAEKGHRVIYLISETHDTSMLDYLRPEIGAGQTNGRMRQLHIQRADSVFDQTGLDGMKFSNWLREETRLAQSEGFSGLSLAVEMGSVMAEQSPTQLQEFESNLYKGLAGSAALALTLYDRRIFPPQHLMHLLAVQPHVIHEGRIKHNPFYVPTDQAAAEESLQRWLDHLELADIPEGTTPETDERLRMIVASMPMIVFALNRHHFFTLIEGKGLALLDMKPGEVVGLDARQVFPMVLEIEMMLKRAMKGETFSLDVHLNGNIYETHCSPLRNPSGEIEGLLGVAVDITDRRLAEQDLRASEERYRLLVENQGEGAGIFGADGQVLYINLAAEGILGLPVDQIIGLNIGDFVPPDQKSIFAQQTAARKAGQASTYEVGFLRRDGQRRQVLVTATPRFDSDGNYLGSFSIFRDITERKRMEDRLRFQSNHDGLTGLFNRNYFEEELKQMNRNRRNPVSVIVVDVDNLKKINDNQGHLSGDELLRRVARLLRSSFRSEDIVARIGGDEFAVILPDSDQKTLERSMERLRHNLDEVNLHQGQKPMSISIGGASADVGQSLLQAFDLADQRMYREKYARKDKS
jgi:diguanylate cyclase (GGDEF)-like protein/PAS domain S-box-containing protein